MARDLDWRAQLDRALREAASAVEGEEPVLSLGESRRLAEACACSLRDVEIRALELGILPLRYRRNIGTLGIEGQRRLLCSTVAVAGCGGLGGWVIEGLARLGIGNLIIADPDRFEESNLNRQMGCLESTLGQYKAECLAARIKEVNAAVIVSAHTCVVTAENGPALFRDAQVIVDALDTLPARYTLARVALEMGVPIVHGAIGGFTGQVMTIFPGDPGLAGLYGEGELPERGIEARLGNPAGTPMMVAGWQVQEVVKVLLGIGAPIRGRVLVMDTEWGDITEITLDRDAQCG